MGAQRCEQGAQKHRKQAPAVDSMANHRNSGSSDRDCPVYTSKIDESAYNEIRGVCRHDVKKSFGNSLFFVFLVGREFLEVLFLLLDVLLPLARRHGG